MSRIFQALRRVEKTNGKATPSPAAKPGDPWPDLRNTLGSGTESRLDSNRVAPPSASNPGAHVRPRPQILGAVAQLGSPQGGKTVGHIVGPGEQWSDIAARINLLPELVEHAEQVACQPQDAERVLTSGGFPALAQESFRVLCQRLLQVREMRRLKTVLVTSPVPHEGKTVVAINLAATLARSSSAVLLVDADLRHPRLPVLGIAPSSGLADYLAGQIELTKTVRRVDPLGFYYQGAGVASTNPSELLQKPALQEFISQAAAAFDWVIFDSPSINLFADPRHLAMLVDGVLLVVREDVTARESVEKSLAALEKAFILGMVFNASTDSPYAHYDLSGPSHTIDKHETVAAAKPSTEGLVGDDPIAQRVLPGQGGLRL